MWAFLLSKILHSLQNKYSSLLNTDEQILPTVHVRCLCLLPSLWKQMLSWTSMPSGIFPCFTSNKKNIPSNCKKKKQTNKLTQLLMIIALSFWCYSCFLLCRKKNNPPSLFLLTRTVILNSRTLWNLQDIQKEIAFYSYKNKKEAMNEFKNSIKAFMLFLIACFINRYFCLNRIWKCPLKYPTAPPFHCNCFSRLMSGFCTDLNPKAKWKTFKKMLLVTHAIKYVHLQLISPSNKSYSDYSYIVLFNVNTMLYIQVNLCSLIWMCNQS